ncbi:MAG: hypothetical protein ACRYFS_03240 [Janthinobacterium lividum]
MKQKYHTLALLPIAAAALLLSGNPAAAQVQIDFQQPIQTGPVGSTFQFFGTITNFGSSAVFISGDVPPQASTLPSGLTLDDSASGNIPYMLSGLTGGNNSYTGELFDVTSAPGTVPSIFVSDFSLTGGTDQINDEFNTLTTQRFGVITTAAVPEASTTVSLGLLLMLGIGGIAFTAHKKAAR